MKKLLVNIVNLNGAQRRSIAKAAEGRGFECKICDGDAEALREAVDAEILFTANPDLARASKALKWLCVPSAGAEAYLDDSLYAQPEARLTNSSGAYGVTIAEHIVMVTLMLMRRMLDYADVVASRQWERGLPIRSIRGSRITLLGTGNIGQEAAARLRAFGPESIIGVNRSGRHPGGEFDAVCSLNGLDDALRETDLLIMSLPGTPETAGIMDARRLSLLPTGAYLVNVGRGSAIDERTLETLLRSGRLAGAALDVFATEPLKPQDPLWDCPRLLITPHVSGNMTLPYTVERIVSQFLEDFENYCDGRPLKRLVDRRAGY